MSAPGSRVDADALGGRAPLRPEDEGEHRDRVEQPADDLGHRRLRVDPEQAGDQAGGDRVRAAARRSRRGRAPARGRAVKTAGLVGVMDRARERARRR